MMAAGRKIFLIGYRATGKSSVGRAVADRLGLPFLDMDQEIERQAGCPISALVAAEGWEGFRQRERELLTALSHRPEALVIATGGGAVLFRDPWPRLKAEHLVVWLTADVATIAARLAADPVTASQRPSLTGQTVQAEIAPVLAEREPLYRESASLAIDTATASLAGVVAEIAAAYRQATEA
ncbi:MAG: shikimate kinase [Thermodesulfobacteriota bacterium]